MGLLTLKRARGGLVVGSWWARGGLVVGSWWVGVKGMLGSGGFMQYGNF